MQACPARRRAADIHIRERGHLEAVLAQDLLVVVRTVLAAPVRCPATVCEANRERGCGRCSRAAAIARPLSAMHGIACRATDGHLQCPDRPPLGRFGFAKSPAGQRVALHAVADRPADVEPVVRHRFKNHWRGPGMQVEERDLVRHWSEDNGRAPDTATPRGSRCS